MNYSFEPNVKFFAYINFGILLEFAYKASKFSEYFLLFFITIVKCMNKRTNTIFEYILDQRYYDNIRTPLMNNNQKFISRIWKSLNETTEYRKFVDELIKLGLYDEKYDCQYKEAYMLYLQNNKGRYDNRIRQFLYGDEKKKLKNGSIIFSQQK